MRTQFPPNLDEDNPLFKTDGFRLFCFKVLPCSKRFCHDWTTCPFSHPSEKAKRRDPRLHAYTGVVCPEMKKNVACPRGDACTFAHNVFEFWLHPSRYRTQLCNDGFNCARKVCFFAHCVEELRVSNIKAMSDEGFKMGSPDDSSIDPFSTAASEDGFRPLASTSPVSPVSGLDQLESFGSCQSSRRTSLQLVKPRHTSMDVSRPQQMAPQRNSLDMAELHMQHLRLAAIKAQLALQQTAALQSLVAVQMQQQITQQPIMQMDQMDHLNQILSQMQLANGTDAPNNLFSQLLPNPQVTIPQVMMQQMMMQQQSQNQNGSHDHLRQQFGGLSADPLGPDHMQPGLSTTLFSNSVPMPCPRSNDPISESFLLGDFRNSL